MQRISPARNAITLPQWAIALCEERGSLSDITDSKVQTPQRLRMTCSACDMTRALEQDKSFKIRKRTAQTFVIGTQNFEMLPDNGILSLINLINFGVQLACLTFCARYS